MDRFDSISPIDYRYYPGNKALFEDLNRYLSERASVRYRLLVEEKIVEALADRALCTREVAGEVARACKEVSAEEVYREEERIRHDVRALVNCIKWRVSDRAKPFVHLTATSSDILGTAESLRLRDVSIGLVVPKLLELEKALIDVARREKDTLQIGRTHGQHAEPITFGFALSEYVSRLGGRVMEVRSKASELRGKMSGAVGSYNASSLFFDDPESFEAEVLGKLGLKAASHSTQIVEPEFVADLVHAMVSAFGVIANLADDLRHLQRSEISEVSEFFGADQVGSSTMPHKRNPISFENVKSMWKAFMPRMTTVYLDQISEHQRDLTNSASSRFVTEIVASLVLSADRMSSSLRKLSVDRESMQRNFDKARAMISAEPAYLLLAAKGHPDAHEFVRKLTIAAESSGKPFPELLFSDSSVKEYLGSISKRQVDVIVNPEKYTGIAARKAEAVCSFWEKRLGI